MCVFGVRSACVQMSISVFSGAETKCVCVCEDLFQWPNTAPIEVSPQAHC